jgi:hypothetical protein
MRHETHFDTSPHPWGGIDFVGSSPHLNARSSDDRRTRGCFGAASARSPGLARIHNRDNVVSPEREHKFPSHSKLGLETFRCGLG